MGSASPNVASFSLDAPQTSESPHRSPERQQQEAGAGGRWGRRDAPDQAWGPRQPKDRCWSHQRCPVHGPGAAQPHSPGRGLLGRQPAQLPCQGAPASHPTGASFPGRKVVFLKRRMVSNLRSLGGHGQAVHERPAAQLASPRPDLPEPDRLGTK